MKNHFWINSRSKRLSVMVHMPSKFYEGCPLVVCCHGFTGDKIGFSQLTLNLANRLEEEGYGVVRFDYIGSGDSDGCFAEDTTVEGWQEDLRNVLGWVRNQFRRSPIVLYGHSLGGLVVLTHQDEIDIIGRAVFAPVIRPIENFRDIILGRELWQQSLTGRPIANFFGKGFKLNSQFVQELVTNDYRPLACAARLNTPILIVHGKLDVVVPIQGSLDLFDQYQGTKQIMTIDADHVATGRQDALQKEVVNWLKTLFHQN